MIESLVPVYQDVLLFISLIKFWNTRQISVSNINNKMADRRKANQNLPEIIQETDKQFMGGKNFSVAWTEIFKVYAWNPRYMRYLISFFFFKPQIVGILTWL